MKPRRNRFRKLNHHATKPIRGKEYREACGRCQLAPWEQCACSFIQRGREV